MQDLSDILDLLEVEVVLQFFILLGASISAFYTGITQKTVKRRDVKINEIEKKAIPFMLEDFNEIISTLNDINVGLNNFQNVPDELKQTISSCCFKVINQLEESNYKSQEALEDLQKIFEKLQEIAKDSNQTR